MSKIPEGFHTITPSIIVKNGSAAIDLYNRALGAEEMGRILLPGSDKIMHACLQIGSSKLFLYDENPEKGMLAPEGGKGGASFYVYVDDVDASHQQALTAGMSEISPPDDMFWGDRMSIVQDEYGHTWSLAAHERDVTQEEMMAAIAEMES